MEEKQVSMKELPKHLHGNTRMPNEPFDVYKKRCRLESKLLGMYCRGIGRPAHKLLQPHQTLVNRKKDV